MHILEDRKSVAHHFEEYRWNYLAEAILDGGHGEVRVDDLFDPHVSMLVLPRVNLFIIGGDPTHPSAQDALASLPKKSILIYGSRTEVWTALAKRMHSTKLIEIKRFAFTNEHLELEHLRGLRDGLSAEYTLKQIDRPLAEAILEEKGPFTEDHLITFDSIDDFLDRGFGFVILEGEKIVSIASTFLVCDAGMEIQINTGKEYEGRGLGTVVGAALIVHALENGIDPSWDAATRTSGHLAKKFGYTEQGEYPMYILFGSRLFGAVLLGLRKIVRTFKKPR